MSDVIMQAAYRQSADTSVPSPYDPTTPHVPWWYDHIASQAQAFAEAGFTMVLLPPSLKTASGAYPDADGYGTYDDYDIGSKSAFGSVATRFGTAEQLRRCAAILRANGIKVFSDIVLHQRSGGRAGNYTYASATSATGGRFPKTPSCFVGSPPRVPRGPIDGPVSDDFGFGDELAPDTSVPAGYVKDGLIAAGQWLTATLGLDGYRIDDVKGMGHQFVHPYYEAVGGGKMFAVGEYYDGNPDTLNWYVWESGMAGAISVFDFTMHFAVMGMCNNNSRWNMEQLQNNGGFFQRSPFKAVTFVENPDTDTDGFATVIWNKILGYAFMLLSEGLPCVYYKDYSTDKGCYGLKQWIDNLIWIRQRFTDNVGTTVRFADYQTYVFERNGKLLVGLNNDQYNSYFRTVATSFGPNVRLHDYTGNAENDIWTDAEGNATIYLPPNNNGHSYTAWAVAGNSEPIVPVQATTTQTFYAAADLDIGPGTPGNNVIGRIWCAKGSTVELTLQGGTGISLQLEGPTGQPELLSDLPATGWYTIVAVGLSTTTPEPYAVTVTYQAPRTLGT